MNAEQIRVMAGVADIELKRFGMRYADVLRACADVAETAARECGRQGCHCLEGNEELHECSFCQIGQSLAKLEAIAP